MDRWFVVWLLEQFEYGAIEHAHLSKVIALEYGGPSRLTIGPQR